jgi:hypothetical protein
MFTISRKLAFAVDAGKAESSVLVAAAHVVLRNREEQADLQKLSIHQMNSEEQAFRKRGR